MCFATSATSSSLCSDVRRSFTDTCRDQRAVANDTKITKTTTTMSNSGNLTPKIREAGTPQVSITLREDKNLVLIFLQFYIFRSFFPNPFETCFKFWCVKTDWVQTGLAEFSQKLISKLQPAVTRKKIIQKPRKTPVVAHQSKSYIHPKNEEKMKRRRQTR